MKRSWKCLWISWKWIPRVGGLFLRSSKYSLMPKILSNQSVSSVDEPAFVSLRNGGCAARGKNGAAMLNELCTVPPAGGEPPIWEGTPDEEAVSLLWSFLCFVICDQVFTGGGLFFSSLFLLPVEVDMVWRCKRRDGKLEPKETRARRRCLYVKCIYATLVWKTSASKPIEPNVKTIQWYYRRKETDKRK